MPAQLKKIPSNLWVVCIGSNSFQGISYVGKPRVVSRHFLSTLWFSLQTLIMTSNFWWVLRCHWVGQADWWWIWISAWRRTSPCRRSGQSSSTSPWWWTLRRGPAPGVKIYNNDLRPIININFYENILYSTFNQRACTSVFN